MVEEVRQEDIVLISIEAIKGIQEVAATLALGRLMDSILEYGRKADYKFTHYAELYAPPSTYLVWAGRAVAALDMAESIQVMIDHLEK